MPIIGTFNGLNIIALPSDTLPGVTAPSSIEWDPQEVVSSNVSPFTGQEQTFDWQASWWEAQVSLPPMSRLSADAWSSFLLQCRGKLNAFMLGDPKAKLPKGSASGAPVVNGAGQTGYSLATRGWAVVNPLQNPSFTQGDTGWTEGAGWSIVAGIGPRGEAFVATYIGPGSAALTNATTQPCAPGRVVSASCQGLGYPGADGSAVLRINFFNASHTLLSTVVSSPEPPAGTGWHPMSVTGTAPAGTASVTLDFAVLGNTNGINWFVSEFTMTNLAGGVYRLLLTGDFIQIGYRFYKVLDAVNGDGDGKATISIWPPLRDLPADGTAIQVANCKGLFRLKNNTGNKWSTNVGLYGASGFAIREAI